MTKEKAERLPMGQWVDELYLAAKEGSYVHFTTREGLIRSGRITGIRTRTIKFNGKDQKIIEEFELNGDEMDSIPFRQLATIVIE